MLRIVLGISLLEKVIMVGIVGVIRQIVLKVGCVCVL